MPSSSSSIAMSLFSLFIISLLFSIVESIVPSSETFKYVNQGEFGPYIHEYGADYRALPRSNQPFQLCFYNTTPNAFTLALRLGTRRSESLRRWVWEANRGNPVGENATLTFGPNGNLVLAHANGKIAWQTNTANKGVVGYKILSNGNIVLYDAKAKFIWQSFDYPTDTLLVGQSFRVGGSIKLVSRASETSNIDGPYSLVMEPKRLAMYFKSPNSPNPLLYSSLAQWFSFKKGYLDNVTFDSSPEFDANHAYTLTLNFRVAKSDTSGNVILSRPKYNTTLSFLRLGIDGNLRIFTFDDNVDWGAWEETFTLFSKDSLWETECQLPERCGKFGICEENQCVGCPSPSGFLGWSKNCEAKKVNSCKVNDFHYYKIEGVDHFMSKYNDGQRLKEDECGKKCSKDCKCLGYFYHGQSSKCWIAYDLLTLDKVSNSTHLGYIKVPNK